ncbi:MAG: hypothetical protein ACKV19_08495 [Verrucomicrobiales bacterium]
MNRTTLNTLLVSALVCGSTLLFQAWRNSKLASQITAERASISRLETELGPEIVAGIGAPRTSTAALTGDSAPAQVGSATATGETSEEKIVSTAASLDALVADIGEFGRSPAAFFKLLPDVLRVVEPLSLDEMLAVAEKVPGSFPASTPSDGRAAVKMILFLLAAESDPRRVMQNKEFMANGEMSAGVIGSLARRDPAAAMDYLKTAEIPQHQKTMLERGMLMQALRRDVNAGLRMMEQMAENGNGSRNEMFHGGVPLPIESLPGLIAARNASENEKLRGTIDTMIVNTALFDGGTDKAREVVAHSNLDTAAVAQALKNSSPGAGGNPGAILDWLAELESPEDFAGSVGHMVRQWAYQDFNAAGEWLGKQEPGPARDRAIHDFAQTVSPIDASAAAIWAAQIENEELRSAALSQTLSQWQTTDQAAADAWIKEQGLDLEDFGRPKQ